MGVGRCSSSLQAQGTRVVCRSPQSPFSWAQAHPGVSWSRKGTGLGRGEWPMAVSECHKCLMVTVHLAGDSPILSRHLASSCPPCWDFPAVTAQDMRVRMRGWSSPEGPAAAPGAAGLGEGGAQRSLGVLCRDGGTRDPVQGVEG